MNLNNSILNNRIELMNDAVAVLKDPTQPRAGKARSLLQQNSFNRLRDLMEYLEELLVKKQVIGQDQIQLCHKLSHGVFQVAVGLHDEWHLGARQFEHLQGLHETIIGYAATIPAHHLHRREPKPVDHSLVESVIGHQLGLHKKGYD